MEEAYSMSRRKIRTPGVYHDRNGTYYLKYKNKTYRGFKTVEDAEIKKAQLMLHAGEHNSRLTFRDVAHDFLSSEKERVRNEEIKYGTYQKKEQLFRNYINEKLSKKKMDDLSLLKLRSFRNEIGALDLSTRQKNYILQITKQIILHGVRYFDVKTDNTIELTYFKKSREESRNNLRDLRNVINDEEFKIFILMFSHGMRVGEVLALLWSKINFDDKSYHC